MCSIQTIMENHEVPLLWNTFDDDLKRSNPKNSVKETVEGDIGPINGVGDFFKEFSVESKKIWYLAGPAIFTYVCQYTLGAITQIFAGQLGTIQLAALSVQNTVIAQFGYGILMGMGSALETICGQAFGANQINVLGIYLQKSWIILNTAAISIMSLFIFATPVLKILGQSAAVSTEAGNFALWMMPQQFAYAVMIPLSKFLQAQSKVMEMAVISVIALGVHVFLSWLLMMKLGWGLSGAALVLNASWWFIAIAQFLYVIAGFCGRAWTGFSWKAFTNLSEFLKLSISSAVMFCLQMWYNTALVLAAGHLKNAEVSVDALSICMNVVGWSGMVGMGFNVAISVRVSNELGSGHPRAAKLSSMVVGVTSLLFGLLFAMILLLGREKYPALFSNSTEVKQLVDNMTPLLGVSIIFTCVQYTLSGVATGAGWQKFVAFLSSGCYFLFGVPLGILMCYKFGMGVEGLWIGMLLGLSLQCCLLFGVICATNWNKEADDAEERLKQWGGGKEGQNDEEERILGQKFYKVPKKMKKRVEK